MGEADPAVGAVTASAPEGAGVSPGSRAAWLLAIRPKTLSAGAAPVLVGTAVAHQTGGVRWGPAIAALVGALLLQIGSNFANDVFDHEKGADTETRLGPLRTVQAGLISPAEMRRGMVVVFGLALLVGAYLVWVAGWPILVLGLAASVSAIAYTVGPFPLGYHGLGDVFVMLWFGFAAVVGTVFVQTGELPGLAWWAALPIGALTTNILVVNNVRDRENDALVGKRTLAVRLGHRGGLAQYGLLLAVAYAVPLGLVASGVVGGGATRFATLLPLLTLPLALRVYARVRRTSGVALNPLLGATARLLAVFGLLFALGLALA